MKTPILTAAAADRHRGSAHARAMHTRLALVQLLDAAIAYRPFTLVYGNLRADNLLFSGEESHPAASIFDWQSACRGALFHDEAIVRHCAVVNELRTWEALPQRIGPRGKWRLCFRVRGAGVQRRRMNLNLN